MSLESQVSDYMRECAASGYCKIEDMHAKLKSEISVINEKLSDVEYLRLQRSNLQKIEAVLSSMLQTGKISDEFEDTSNEMKLIRNQIINIISNNVPLSNREIILELCKTNKDAYGQDANVIRCIKYLSERGIIEKNSDRKIVKGQNWVDYNT